MINNFFIIKELLLSKLKKQPYKLNFVITNKCNSKCLHCNIWRVYKNDSSRFNDELKIDEIEKIFKNLSKNIFWLAITGGEPFLRDDLIEIIKLAKKNIKSLKILSIPSNGLLTNKIIDTVNNLKKIKGVIFFLTFSIDGPEEIHDKLRGIKGAYKKTMNTYNLLKQIVPSSRNLNILLEVTVSKYNFDYLYNFFYEQIKNGYKKKFIITLYHNAYLYKNENVKDNYLEIDYKKFKKVLELINKNLSYFSPTQFIQKKYLSNIMNYLKNPNNQVLPCVALKDSFAIGPCGEVLPCLMWGKILGNIRDCDYNIKKIWNSNSFSNVRNEIRNGRCPNCWTPCEAYQTLISNLIPFNKK